MSTSPGTSDDVANSPQVADQHPIGARKPIKTGTKITVFGLAMLNVAAVAGLGNDSEQAFYGLTSVTYFGLAAVFFLIPVCLVAAELASGWPLRGGIFRWVGEGLGRGLGFAAIFLLFLEVTLMQASSLTNVTNIIGFGVSDYESGLRWANHPTMWVVLVFGIIYYWLLTYLSTKGIKVFTAIAKWGVVFATLVPLVLMVVLVIIWLVQGGHWSEGMGNLTSHDRGIIPDFKGFSTLALAVGVFFSFAGMEMNAAHIKDLKNPRRAYPLAILIAAVLAMAIFVIGTVIIAIVVPYKDLNAIYSLYTTFYTLGAAIHVPWLYAVIAWASIISLGTATISWLAGVPLMLTSAGRSGLLPRRMQKINKHGMPSFLLYMMAIIISLIFLLMMIVPSMETYFVMVTAATTLLYLTMYILMFVAFIRLRYTQPNRPRSFKVPGGKAGAWIVGGVGLVSTAFGCVLGFFPPAQLSFGSPAIYVGTIAALLIVSYLATWLLYRARKEKWVDPTNDMKPFTWEIEGMKKVGKSTSNVPADVLAQGQVGMGSPITKFASPEETLSVDQLVALGVDEKTAKKVGAAAGAASSPGTLSAGTSSSAPVKVTSATSTTTTTPPPLPGESASPGDGAKAPDLPGIDKD